MKNTKENIYKRYLDILKELAARPVLSHEDIKESYSLSPQAFWRDIVELDKMGLLDKKGSKAKSKMVTRASTNFTKRSQKNVSAKEAIAQLAIEKFLKGQDLEKKITIFLDSGTTNEILFKKIIADEELREKEIIVVTNNVSLLGYRSTGNVTLIMSGGEYAFEERSLIGNLAARSFAQYPARYAFLSASNLNFDGGFLGYNSAECRVKKNMIMEAKETIILADDSKFDFVGGEKISDFYWLNEQGGNRLQVVVEIKNQRKAKRPIRMVTNESSGIGKRLAWKKFWGDNDADREAKEKYIYFAGTT